MKYNAMKIPANLESYLKEHLKIMMLLRSKIEREEEAAEWGIYFSIKNLRGSNYVDDEFKGEVNGSPSNKLGWKAEKSLWLVPLNETANEISKNVKNGIEQILFSSLFIKNEIGGNRWSNYTFDGTGSALELNIEENTEVNLSKKSGVWHTLEFKGEEKWNIWLTSEEFVYNDKIISFNAPSSHIIDDDQTYRDFELSVGVRNKNSEFELKGPYLSIDEKESKKNGKDCPFIWLKDYRYDDVVVTPPESEKKFTTKNFIGNSLLRNVGIEGANRTQAMLDCLNEKDSKNLTSWILKEDQSLSVIYAKSYSPQKIKFIGDNFVKILQVNRKEKAFIYLKLYNPQDVLAEGSSLFNKVKNGLEYTQSSNPIGIVPDIEEITGISSLAAEWETDYGSSVCRQKEYSLNNSFVFTNSGTPDNLQSLRVKLPLLKAAKSDLELTKAKIQTDIDIQELNDNGTVLRMIFSGYRIAINLTLIDGAFEFELKNNETPADKLPPKKFGEIRFTLQNKRTQQPFFFWQYHKNIGQDEIVLQYSIEDFSLPVKSVRAAGQDLINNERFLAPGTIGAIVEGQGERNDQPLVVPIENRSTADNYFLTFSESVNVGQDYRLDVKLQELYAEAGADNSSTVKAVIIDTNPQFIGLLDARFLQQPGFDDGAWILARRSQLSLENGAWEILDDSANTEGFKLILPAQAIGEAYVKTDEKDGNANDGEPKEGKPIEHKFGAPAILKISNERLERRYVAPPWNLRHIWGQPGNESPGVPFLEAQFEFLYGLTGHLKPENTFIAELASKLGEIPVPPDNSIFWKPTEAQKDAFETSWKNYLRFYRAWKSRLAILELSKEDAFGNAKFVENLKYSPRIDFKPRIYTAQELDSIINQLKGREADTDITQSLNIARELKTLHAAEKLSREELKKLLVDDNRLKESLTRNTNTQDIAEEFNFYERVGASLRYPIKDGTEILENPEIRPEQLNDPKYLKNKIEFSHDKHGLAGGFHYGFESGAIYEEFWREAFKDGSSSAELKAPAFSSLGGWGKQTARFAGDKTVIKSTTAMGRTNFYAVERIGRIACLWHKAKHVIEYERTVVPSDYFPEQPALAGRPLVRKVREYVEILEPVKNYPDFENQSDDAPGAVKACHFKSIVIPVRSSWGKDVSFKIDGKIENYGWEIQLWHPDADPKLFPKPQVVFELLAPADSNVESVTVNLSEPQNLRFYTDTRPTVDFGDGKPVPLTADTTKWQAIKYVDYTDLKLPNERHLAPVLDANSGKGMEQTMPEILDVPPGFERFTFRVDKCELPSGVANRYNPKSAISGKMKAVTMMRKPVVQKKKDEETPNTEPPPNAAQNAFDILAEDSKGLINQIYNGALNGLETPDLFSKKISEIFTATPIAAKLTELNNELNTNDKVVLKHFATIYSDHEGKLETFPTKYLWKEAVISAEGLLNRTLAIYDEQVEICKNEVAEILKQGAHQKDEAADALKRFKDRVGAFRLNIDFGVEFFADIQRQFEFGINQLESKSVYQANKILEDITVALTRIENLIDVAEEDLDAFKEKSVEILNEILAKCTSIQTNLGNIKLDGVEKFVTSLTTIIGEITTACAELKTEIEKITLPAELDNVRDKLDELKPKISIVFQSYLAKFSEFLAAVKTIAKTGFGEINKQLKDLNQKLESLESTFIKLIVDEIKTLIKLINDEWETNIQGLPDKLKIQIDAIRDTFILSNTPCEPTIDKILTQKTISVKCLLKYVLYNDDKIQNSDGKAFSVFAVLEQIDQYLLVINQYLLSFFENPVISNLIEQATKFGESDDVKQWLETLDACKKLKDAIENGNREEIIKKSAALADSINQEFGKLAGEVAEKVKQYDQAAASFEAMQNSGKQVLDNYRSVWDEFNAPGMGLNRKTVAMLVNKDWSDVEERLSITPCVARVKQFQNDLEALGLRLPVTNVFEGLLPPKPEWAKDIEDYGKSLLNKFNFSDVLSDIGALRLDKMFPNFKMPDNLRDNIKITQGFDKQNLTAWVNAEVNFKLTEVKSLLNIGPIELKLNQGKFVAKVRMEMDVEGNSKKENSGMLAGNWETHIANTPIMIFKEAKAIFENDKLSFDLDPNRMEMPGLLKLLTDATKQIPTGAGSGSGTSAASGTGGKEKEDVFKIGLLEVEGETINQALTGRKIPVGVKATLDIPPISVGGGTTSMTNLSFGGHFILQFWDRELKKFGFMTGLGFYLGKQDAPFNFTAFILGGGGFVNCNIGFRPEQGLTVKFVLSVHASAGFAITAGWINGSVLICLGLEGEYNKLPGSESRASVSIFVQIIGKVDIMGLATVFLSLRLEANYNGSRLLGTGTVKLRIKICWCVTIKVEKKYTKELVGKEKSNNTESENATKISSSLG